jgi:hypothetical protein
VNEHRFKLGERIRAVIPHYYEGNRQERFRGQIIRLGRECSVGGDHDDGYDILLDDGRVQWIWEWEAFELSLLEKIAEAARDETD